MYLLEILSRILFVPHRNKNCRIFIFWCAFDVRCDLTFQSLDPSILYLNGQFLDRLSNNMDHVKVIVTLVTNIGAVRVRWQLSDGLKASPLLCLSRRCLQAQRPAVVWKE